MSQVNWLEVLGWDKMQVDDMRFIGFSYIKQGQYTIALKFFEALAILNPQNAYDLQTLGALYLQMGNNTQALDYLERSLRLNKDHGPTLLNRAKALFLLGYKKQALDQVQTLEKHPSLEIARQAKALALSYH
ncbi:MAG: tetratricopeptide repeat protein [Chlamydiae bacterium]|nr:tetratricopeptide repeat protein [Chlamydiota bacterium]